MDVMIPFQTCLDAESLVLECSKQLFPSTFCLSVSTWEIIKSLAKSWAEELDSFVSPTVAYEIALHQKHNMLKGNSPSERYASFFEQSNIRRCQLKYPLLNQRIQLFLHNRLQNLRTCLSRLVQDWNHLACLFQKDSDQAKSISMEESLVNIVELPSDSHERGQRVLLLTFRFGDQIFSIVYKVRGAGCMQFLRSLINVSKIDLRLMNVYLPNHKVVVVVGNFIILSLTIIGVNLLNNCHANRAVKHSCTLGVVAQRLLLLRCFCIMMAIEKIWLLMAPFRLWSM